MSNIVDPSRNPLHDPESGLYHGDVPVDVSRGPVLTPADAASVVDAGPLAYDDMTVAQLKDEAKGRDLSGYSNLSKDDLIALLIEDDESDDD